MVSTSSKNPVKTICSALSDGLKRKCSEWQIRLLKLCSVLNALHVHK